MWIIVLEIWAVDEEIQQFNCNHNYSKEVMNELTIYSKFRELFVKKFETMQKQIGRAHV